ncbi:ABC transporter substrate-binding protein [Betaproteobacteria bacterium]|nr:ABC transporter substrate-binding protein [Betaproteobacteria bacterium]
MLLNDNFNSMRRRLIQSTAASIALGAGAGFALPAFAAQETGTRNTNTVRLTWGPGGMPRLAKDRGVFEKTLAKQGIKVEWVGPFPNHSPTLQAVVGGSADFGFYGSTTPTLAALIAGSPLVFTQFFAVTPSSTAIIVKKDSAINSVKDLVGKSVAINRSGLGEFLLVAALEKYSIAREKVRFVYLNPPDAAPAFGQGKVDAWSMWSPGVDIAREKYNGKDIFLEGRDLDFVIDYSTLVTTRKFVTENSALVRAVINAYTEEGKWADEHIAESEAIYQNAGKYGDSTRDYLISLNRKRHFYEPDDPDFLKKFQWAADWLTERNIISRKVNVADYVVKT